MTYRLFRVETSIPKDEIMPRLRSAMKTNMYRTYFSKPPVENVSNFGCYLFGQFDKENNISHKGIIGYRVIENNNNKNIIDIIFDYNRNILGEPYLKQIVETILTYVEEDMKII